MILYNGIYIHSMHNATLNSHLRSLAATGRSMRQCLYYGMGETVAAEWTGAFHHVGCHGTRDNMALKTYGMMKHALESDPCWTHLLKTDVLCQITCIKFDLLEQSDFGGHAVAPDNEDNDWRRRVYKNEEREPLLREPWRGKLPAHWCSGTAYAVSRRLAEWIVQRGAWAARGWFAEDLMVAAIAEEHGLHPVPCISFRSKGIAWGFSTP